MVTSKLTKRRKTRENPEIREFILRNLPEHPRDIVAVATEKFGISRQSLNAYIRRLIAEKLVRASGRTRARKYELRDLVDMFFKIELFKGLAEHTVWQFKVLPKIKKIPKNILDICDYGFTEILNNASEHSGGTEARIWLKQNYATITISIGDNGIGIFEKIKRDFKLPDAQSALLELSKGRITSDAATHAGEGIFYTSRMFEKFRILSKGIFYAKELEDSFEWLIESGPEERPYNGTLVEMTISTNAKWTKQDVFDRYSRDQLGFRKTHVPIRVGLYPGEQLVSRSQAKRILSRFEQFSEVMLDFQGVDTIGQPFADEIFRVFRHKNPNTEVHAFNTTPEIRKMIEYVEKSPAPTSPKKLGSAMGTQ